MIRKCRHCNMFTPICLGFTEYQVQLSQEVCGVDFQMSSTVKYLAKFPMPRQITRFSSTIQPGRPSCLAFKHQLLFQIQFQLKCRLKIKIMELGHGGKDMTVKVLLRKPGPVNIRKLLIWRNPSIFL